MTAPRFAVIADRDRGDDPRPQDIQDGDRYVLDAPYLGDTSIVRIERPVRDAADGGRYEYRVIDLDVRNRAAGYSIPSHETARFVLERDRTTHSTPDRLILQRRWVGDWEDAAERATATSAAARPAGARCPRCRHAPHPAGGCLNAASDNDCGCAGASADGDFEDDRG